jgi:hypothetical protein
MSLRAREEREEELRREAKNPIPPHIKRKLF